MTRSRIAIVALLIALLGPALAFPQTTVPRTEAAKRQFMRQTGFPDGRPGYVVDHIIPLVCGGADTPANMQWQTIAEAKAKDKELCMRHSLILIVLLGASVTLTSCGGSGDSPGAGSPTAPSSPSGSGLAGTWKASKAEFTSVANPSQKVEVVSLGVSVTLLIATGSFTLTIAEPGVPPQVTNGAWTSSQDTLKLTPAGMLWSWEFDMSLSGNTLTLTGATVEFDVNGDDRDEQAKLNMTMTRQ